MLVLGAAALLIVWFFWLDNSTLFKTSLNTSFNRFSSTEVKLSIPTPGLLTISAGPSTLLTGATVFAITLDLGTSTATDVIPFPVDPAVFTTIVNAPSPTDPKEIMLAVSFLEGAFTGTNLVIAQLPFATTLAGQFEVKSVYFGSLPTASFPPFQDYPIFIESSNFLYDEKGAAKLLVTPPTTPPPTTA